MPYITFTSGLDIHGLFLLHNEVSVLQAARSLMKHFNDRPSGWFCFIEASLSTEQGCGNHSIHSCRDEPHGMAARASPHPPPKPPLPPSPPTRAPPHLGPLRKSRGRGPCQTGQGSLLTSQMARAPPQGHFCQGWVRTLYASRCVQVYNCHSILYTQACLEGVCQVTVDRQTDLQGQKGFCIARFLLQVLC